MATVNEAKEGFEFLWIIHNFNFCWHKTGEELDSPSFRMDNSSKISWKLRLYPRGENDGEYISCYLCREKDGPEIVDVDFELFLTVGDSGQFEVRNPVSFSKIYSSKPFQMEGLTCFASRRKIFAVTNAQKERLTLSVRCTIFRVNGNKSNGTQHFGRTTIITERISGTEVIDDPSDLDPENCKDVDVKPQFCEKPLIGINVSCLQESLVIKIRPRSCDRIKYAVCKITLVNELRNDPPIEYVRCWIGEIKAHIWRHKPLCQDSESDKSSPELILAEALILHYEFEFSTGSESFSNSLIPNPYQEVCNRFTAPRGYFKTQNFTLAEYLNIKLNTTTCTPTALGALNTSLTSESFKDLVVKVKTLQATSFSSTAHKALLSVRSAIWKSEIQDGISAFNVTCRDFDIFKNFLTFVYTDSVEIQSVESALGLYSLAAANKVEILQMKCSLYLTSNLHYENVCFVLIVADIYRDSSMKDIAINYIITYLDLVIKTEGWRDISRIKKTLVRKILLLKYSKKEPMH